MPAKVIKTASVASNIGGIEPHNGKIYVCTDSDPAKLIELDYDLNILRSIDIGKHAFDFTIVNDKVYIVTQDNIKIVDINSFNILNSITPPKPSGTSYQFGQAIEPISSTELFVSYSFSGSFGYRSYFYKYSISGDTLNLTTQKYLSGWSVANAAKYYNGYVYCAGYKGYIRKINPSYLSVVKSYSTYKGYLTDDMTISNNKIYTVDLQYDDLYVFDLDLNLIKKIDLPFSRTDTDPIEGYGNDAIGNFVLLTSPIDDLWIIDSRVDRIVETNKISDMYRADELKVVGSNQVLIANFHDDKVFLVEFTEPSIQYATLNISTTPSGASVYIDGVYRGTT